MKHIVVGFIFYFLLVPLVRAQGVATCTPPASPSVMTQVAPGTAQWTNVGNIANDDGKLASFNNFSKNHIKDFAARLVFVDRTIGSVDKAQGTEWNATQQYVSYGQDSWNTKISPHDVNTPDFGFALAVGSDTIKSNFIKATHFGFRVPPEATITRVTAEVKRWDILDAENNGGTVGYIDHIRMVVCYESPAAPPISGTDVDASALVLARVDEHKHILVAPGEVLTIPLTLQKISLANGTKIHIQYQLRNTLLVVSEITETISAFDAPIVAKSMLIPTNLAPGIYELAASMDYAGHHYTDVLKFPFTVEHKIAGFFFSQVRKGLLWFFASSVVLFGIYLWTKHRHDVVMRDYGHIPESHRMYYEMIGDMISQMHDSIGDRAYKMADAIGGLSIDKSTGKILNITKDPSEILSVLYIKYQTVFKKKLKILAKSGDKKNKDTAALIEQDVQKFEKYFGKK